MSNIFRTKPSSSSSIRARTPYTLGRPLSILELFFFREEEYLRSSVLDLLTPVDVTSLSGTSTRMRAIVLEYRRQAWNVNRFLSPWFSSVTGFRCALAKAGAVVTGSQALRFFDRTDPDLCCDLDVVTRIGGAPALAIYLENDGYSRHFASYPRHSANYPMLIDLYSIASKRAFKRGGGAHGILHIMDFKKNISIGPDDALKIVTLKVQIIVVTQEPVEHICLTFHSSKPHRLLVPSQCSPCSRSWRHEFYRSQRSGVCFSKSYLPPSRLLSLQ
jgi:hypothetical protein